MSARNTYIAAGMIGLALLLTALLLSGLARLVSDGPSAADGGAPERAGSDAGVGDAGPGPG